MAHVYTLSLPVQALLATIFTWSVTALGAALVILSTRMTQRAMDGMLGFGAGVMLASSFWSLLEPGIAMATEIGQHAWLVAAVGFLAGGLIPEGGEWLLRRVSRRSDQPDDSRRRIRLLITSITLHNIPEGLAIGVAFGALAFTDDATALAGAWMLALGIGLQNFPEGAAVSLPLRREGMGRGRAFFFGQLSGVVEPIAAVLGALLAVGVRAVLPFTLCFAAGAMIAVTVSELIPESQRNPKPAVMTRYTLLGFVVMMVLDVALG